MTINLQHFRWLINGLSHLSNKSGKHSLVPGSPMWGFAALLFSFIHQSQPHARGPRRHWGHSQLALGKMGHRGNRPPINCRVQTWTRTQHPTERTCTLHPKGPQFNHLHHHPSSWSIYFISKSPSLTLKVNYCHQLSLWEFAAVGISRHSCDSHLLSYRLVNFRNSLCPDENDLTNWDCQPQPYFVVFVSERFSVLREAICTCNISVMLVLLFYHYNLKRQRVSIVIVSVVPPKIAQKAQTC